MILGLAIAKVSDSQILCEWGDETQPNIFDTRSHIKNFLREKTFLSSHSKFAEIADYSIYHLTKKTCVYLAIYNKTKNYGHVKDCIGEVQKEFEEVDMVFYVFFWGVNWGFFGDVGGF